MQALSVSGGVPLRGEVVIHGAKNSALPILAASLLCRSPCVLHNCPNIEDVETTLQLLRCLGCTSSRSGSTVFVDTSKAENVRLSAELTGKMRSSIIFLGAVFARFGEAELAMPGGCPLGARPIDLHLYALRQLGAACSCSDQAVVCREQALHGADIVLPFPSVGATENALLAALRCAQPSVIRNAALEPEITDLARFLQSAGAEISGVGTSVLTVRGGVPLHGTTYTILPDRMQAASFLCAAAGCGGEVTLLRTDGAALSAVCRVLRSLGCTLTPGRDTLHISAPLRLRANELRVATAPYPGFATDAQSPLTAAVLRAEGTSEICETIFENRFHHVAQLKKLGAQIVQRENTLLVRGVPQLQGAALQAEDLRGAMALVIGALQASGRSTITGIEHLRRGYERLEPSLRALGADIKCVEIR